MREIKINKIYRHFKGDLYLVQGIATHSETGEKYVVYRALYGDAGLYIRPYDMFASADYNNKCNSKKNRFHIDRGVK